jgi:eukaryotic-like serine/threonine-protein kinase
VAEPHPLLADRYRLVRQVGSGGMGVVWEAWDERLERPVAVKQLRPQLGLTPEEAELAKNRAMREARITARLHHRNAVPVFDVVEHAGQPCLIMQFLPSVPLSAELREGGPLSVREAARVGAQVASALAAAHQLGIVHRDVKPGNILITDDGTALISDFGISHALGDATLTSTGLVHGTPAYLAPEVARGADSGFASDVFSLGATLYACLEGGPPFGTDSNSIALLHKVASGEFAPPQRAGELAPVLLEMLRSDPDARPAMKEAATRLAAAEVGDASSAATLPLLATERRVETPQESSTTTQVRRTEGPPTYAAAAPAPSPASAPAEAARAVAATAAAQPVAAPPPAPLAPSASSPPPSDPGPPRRRRRGAWVAALALLVGLVVLGTALVNGLVAGGNGTAADPGTLGTSASATSAPSESSSGSGSSGSAEPSESASSESTAPSPSATTKPSPSASPSSGEPTADELEAAITTYYGLVPDDTDKSWPLMTKNYQQNTSGGRQSYQRFWDQVDSVKVSKVKASPPDRVDATVTYRRGGSVSVERTSFRLVRDDGVLKIDHSSVLSSS